MLQYFYIIRILYISIKIIVSHTIYIRIVCDKWAYYLTDLALSPCRASFKGILVPPIVRNIYFLYVDLVKR